MLWNVKQCFDKECGMSDLKFNIYGFARPTTAAERTELLIEALRVADELLDMIDGNDAFLNAHVAPVSA